MHPSAFARWHGCVLAAIGLCLAATAAAQNDGHPIPSMPFESDHVGLKAWQGDCPVYEIDPNRAPTVRRTGETHDAGGYGYTYDLTYYAIDTGLCFSTPSGSFSHSWHVIDVGTLPLGINDFTIRGILPDGTELIEYHSAVWVSFPRFMRTDVTGIWYAREQDGRGVTVMQSSGKTLLYWATHDATGAPAWVFLPPTESVGNVVAGDAVTTHGDPLAAGAATLEASPWGHVSFTYDRCGRGTLAWNANDEAIGDGSLDLVQVMVPDATRYPCLAEDDPLSVRAIWLED